MNEHFIPRVTFGSEVDAELMFNALNAYYATGNLPSGSTAYVAELLIAVHAEWKRLAATATTIGEGSDGS